MDKPAGPSSFDVVRSVRRALGTKKVGHTGTLDPMADGLMVICVGHATRVVPYLTAEDKAYEAVIQLGARSNTYDKEGLVERVATVQDVVGLETADIEAALNHFRGTFQQTPPAFSAIKVKGERLYAKARRGEKVDVPTRTVRVDACTLKDRAGDTIHLYVHCAKGTYIRSIAHDLGALLGVGGLLVALRRVSVGRHRVEDAITLSEFESLSASARQGCCMSVGAALTTWPRVKLNAVQARQVSQGQTLGGNSWPHENFLAYDSRGDLIALMEGCPSSGQPKILRGFPSV